ncbi:MAG TPA: hypothetical protein VFC09_09770 [Candidatus Dormibacteraeota bacterium]|nr:hypothetical protein [Candidatus Dormibacteraeota bacterium]
MSIVVGSPQAMSAAVLGPTDLPTQQVWNPARYAAEQQTANSQMGFLQGPDGMKTLLVFAIVGIGIVLLERHRQRHHGG